MAFPSAPNTPVQLSSEQLATLLSLESVSVKDIANDLIKQGDISGWMSQITSTSDPSSVPALPVQSTRNVGPGMDGAASMFPPELGGAQTQGFIILPLGGKLPPNILAQLQSSGLIPRADPSEKELRPPRPPNSFILYRADQHKKFRSANPSLRNETISKLIGDAWKAESDEVRARYQALAKTRSDQHRRRYPDYRYQPRRKSKSHTLS